MSRRAFTKALSILIEAMIIDGEEPVIDYVLRSTEEQQRLWAIGRTMLPSGVWIETNSNRIVTKVDGIDKKSQHQRGLAADIYLTTRSADGGCVVDYNWTDKDKATRYHKKWEELGGDPMIVWDSPHFQFSK